MSAWIAVGAVAVAGTIAFGVASVGEAAHDAAVAQSAADAAALAGAASGNAPAAAVAELNGARLVSLTVSGNVTRVVVEVDGTEAQAAAERLVIPVP